jgi:hypothetical protein
MSVAFGSVEAERLRTQSVFGLYSPRRVLYDVVLPYDSAAFPFEQNAGIDPTAGNVDAIVRAGDLTLRDVRTDTSEVATFMVESHQPRPAISATATLAAEGDALEVVVRNDGNAVLENALLIYGQEQMGLGDLAPGEEQTAQLSLIGATAGLIPTPDPLFPAAIAIPNPMLNDSGPILGTADFFNDPVAYPRWQFLQSQYYGDSYNPAALPDPTETITLAGWLDGGAEEASVSGGEASQSGVTLLLLEVPVR